jgi:hypothetical protein
MGMVRHRDPCRAADHHPRPTTRLTQPARRPDLVAEGHVTTDTQRGT